MTFTLASCKAKKRQRRDVLVLRWKDNFGEEQDFSIDEEDYGVIRDILFRSRISDLQTQARDMVKIREGDVERRVQELRMGNLFDDILSLPTSIGRLNNLTFLDLQNLKITSLPLTIGNLENLTHLCLRHSSIALLPSSIRQLKKLKDLDLSCTENLSSLPEEIGALTSLSKLDLSFSMITALPPSIGHLENLVDLNLSETKKLSSLPEEIWELPNLSTLRMCNSVISTLPPFVGRLRNLRDLDLSSTKNLSELPKEIGELLNLKTLRLSNSFVRLLPPSIGKLQNLNDLNLSSTQSLSKVPDEIGNLTNLKTLDLRYSGISWLSLPDSMGRMAGLMCLGLHVHESEKLNNLIGEIRFDFLLMLAQRCRFLESLAERMNTVVEVARLVNTPYAKKLVYALACNRARSRTGFATIDDESVRITPGVWPIMLKNATRAFDGDRYFRWIKNPDAIYQLLVIGRDSFVSVLINGRSKDCLTKTKEI